MRNASSSVREPRGADGALPGGGGGVCMLRDPPGPPFPYELLITNGVASGRSRSSICTGGGFTRPPPPLPLPPPCLRYSGGGGGSSAPFQRASLFDLDDEDPERLIMSGWCGRRLSNSREARGLSDGRPAEDPPGPIGGCGGWWWCTTWWWCGRWW